MKLKYYLRGIGIGVFVTTVIFMSSISLHKNENTDASKENSMTVEALENSTQNSQAPEDVKKDRKPKEESVLTKQEPEVQNKPKETEKTEEEGLKEVKEQPKENKETELEEEPEDKVRFEVSNGEFSDTVSRKLEAAGLIDDAASFNRFLVEKDYDDSILPGTYDIPKDATYDEIAALLTLRARY